VGEDLLDYGEGGLFSADVAQQGINPLSVLRASLSCYALHEQAASSPGRMAVESSPNSGQCPPYRRMTPLFADSSARPLAFPRARRGAEGAWRSRLGLTGLEEEDPEKAILAAEPGSLLFPLIGCELLS